MKLSPVGRRTMVAAALCMGSTGCFHKRAPVSIPVAAQAPVPLEKAPEPKNPPMVQSVPLQTAPLPVVTVPAKKVKKAKRKIAAVPAAPAEPVQVAGVGPASEASASVIGSLTPGGDSTPEKHRQATELIAAVDRRLASLPTALVERQKEGIVRVKYFEREALTALHSGDADGAWTLATKAKLLLDDLSK